MKHQSFSKSPKPPTYSDVMANEKPALISNAPRFDVVIAELAKHILVVTDSDCKLYTLDPSINNKPLDFPINYKPLFEESDSEGF